MDAIAEKTKRIIADTLGADASTISPETNLKKDLGADSLDVVELAMILEKEFRVSIPDEKLERMTQVKHFIEHFERVKPLPQTYFEALRAA